MDKLNIGKQRNKEIIKKNGDAVFAFLIRAIIKVAPIIALFWTSFAYYRMIKIFVGYPGPEYSFITYWFNAAIFPMLSVFIFNYYLSKISPDQSKNNLANIRKAGHKSSFLSNIFIGVTVIWSLIGLGIADSLSLGVTIIFLAGISIPVFIAFWTRPTIRAKNFPLKKKILFASWITLVLILVWFPPYFQVWRDAEWSQAASAFSGFLIPNLNNPENLSESRISDNQMGQRVVVLDCDDVVKLHGIWHHLPARFRAVNRSQVRFLICITTEKSIDRSVLVGGWGVPLYRRGFRIRFFEQEHSKLIAEKIIPGESIYISVVGDKIIHDGTQFSIKGISGASVITDDSLRPLEVLGPYPANRTAAGLILETLVGKQGKSIRN